jgi:3-oxoacyl-[acyl-carrier protein] reductase
VRNFRQATVQYFLGKVPLIALCWGTGGLSVDNYSGWLAQMRLDGKTALVCGASSGIGQATAHALAEQGARVIALARREDLLKSMILRLPGSGHRALVVDLSDLTSVRAKIKSELEAVGGTIHILICNSSGPKGGAIVNASEEDFLKSFSQHVLANQILVQELLPGMRRASFGRIVTIISTSVKVPIQNLGVSNTVRAAVASWAKTLSLEVAADGITVNSVLPGFTDTDRLSELARAGAETQGVSEEQVRTTWAQATPMKRIGKPSEIAHAVGFFASPAASFITGTALAVDGGRTGTLS